MTPNNFHTGPSYWQPTKCQAHNQTLLSGIGDQFNESFKDSPTLGKVSTTKALLPSRSDPNLPLRLAGQDAKEQHRSTNLAAPRAKSAPLSKNEINKFSSSGFKMNVWLSNTDDRDQYQRSYGGAGKIAKTDT